MNPFESHGAFSWAELMTRDIDGAKKFYSEVFGWELEDSPMPGTDMTYTVIKVDGHPMGGMMNMPPDMPEETPPNWGTYVTVDSVDESSKKVKELGGEIVFPPMDIQGVGRFCIIQDPQGAFIAMIAYEKKE